MWGWGTRAEVPTRPPTAFPVPVRLIEMCRVASGVESRPTDRGVGEVLARECGAAAFICKGNDLKASFASSGPEVLISFG